MRDPTVIRQNLYLNGEREVEVTLEENTLVIRVADQADRLFPLARVAQITADVRVNWQSRALMACAREGIGVAFREPQGALIGRLVGQGSERQGLMQQFANLLQRPDWPELYPSMIQALTWQAQIRLCQFLRLGECDGVNHPRSGLVSRVEQMMVQLSSREEVRQLNRYWLNGCESAVVAQLQQEGYTATLAHQLREGPDLVADLATILEWETRSPRIGWLQRRRAEARLKGVAAAPITEEAVVALLEQTDLMIQKRVRMVVGKLQRWLVELEI